VGLGHVSARGLTSTDLKEERDVAAKNSWVVDPVVVIIAELEASIRNYPPIKLGTPDPYVPPN
jgi:arylsulfatase